MKKFWNWKKIKNKYDTTENILFLNGTIAEESWLDDDITPGLFKSELKKLMETLQFGLILMEEM